MIQTYLTFNIGKEVYAIKTEKVLEVLQHQNITVIPNSPEYLNGIVNFRGEGIPIFDARVQFNLTQKVDMNKAFIIVVDLHFENETVRTGAVVDKVLNVLPLNSEDILEVPPMKKHFNIEFLEGVVKHNDDFLLLLNMEKVFTFDQTEYLKQVNNSEQSGSNAKTE